MYIFFTPLPTSVSHLGVTLTFTTANFVDSPLIPDITVLGQTYTEDYSVSEPAGLHGWRDGALRPGCLLNVLRRGVRDGPCVCCAGLRWIEVGSVVRHECGYCLQLGGR